MVLVTLGIITFLTKDIPQTFELPDYKNMTDHRSRILYKLLLFTHTTLLHVALPIPLYVVDQESVGIFDGSGTSDGDDSSLWALFNDIDGPTAFFFAWLTLQFASIANCGILVGVFERHDMIARGNGIFREFFDLLVCSRILLAPSNITALALYFTKQRRYYMYLALADLCIVLGPCCGFSIS